MAKGILKKALDVVGRDVSDPGAHMYHASDGVAGGGKVNNHQRHKIRKALARQRMRATGMTDDIFGSKEVGGRFENKHEREV